MDESKSESETSKESQTKSKRIYQRTNFSLEDEETLIEFVKGNAELYDPKHKLYANRIRKSQLWQDFASKLNKTGKQIWKILFFPYFNVTFSI